MKQKEVLLAAKIKLTDLGTSIAWDDIIVNVIFFFRKATLLCPWSNSVIAWASQISQFMGLKLARISILVSKKMECKWPRQLWCLARIYPAPASKPLRSVGHLPQQTWSWSIWKIMKDLEINWTTFKINCWQRAFTRKAKGSFKWMVSMAPKPHPLNPVGWRLNGLLSAVDVSSANDLQNPNHIDHLIWYH